MPTGASKLDPNFPPPSQRAQHTKLAERTAKRDNRPWYQLVGIYGTGRTQIRVYHVGPRQFVAHKGNVTAAAGTHAGAIKEAERPASDPRRAKRASVA